LSVAQVLVKGDCLEKEI